MTSYHRRFFILFSVHHSTERGIRMNEELLPDDLFDFDEPETDSFDDETEDEVEEVETEDEVEDIQDTPDEDEPTDETEDEGPFLNIKYNHEDKALTREEAITLAQKGMNYDNLNDRYTQLNSEVEQLARMNGMNVSEYLKSLKDMQTNFAINKEVQNLKQQYPDANEELLKEIAQKRVAETHQNQQKDEATMKKQEDDAKRNEIARQLDIFQKKYPNVDAQNMDQQVYKLMGEGYTMLEAYSIWKDDQNEVRTKEQAKKDAAKKANAANKKKGLGNVDSAGNAEKDIFLSEFLS